MVDDGDSDSNCKWRSWNNLERIGKGIRRQKSEDK